MTDDTATQPVEENTSLADELSKAFEELESKEDGDDEVLEGPSTETSESDEDAQSGDDKSDEESDEDGADDEGADDEEPSSGDEDDSESDDEPLEAPQHWAAADRERFSQQPKDVQEWMLERHKAMEADYTRKTQDIAEQKRFNDQVTGMLEPYRQAFAMQGMDDVGAIRFLVGWKQHLDTNPVQAIQQLAQDYGVDFSQPNETDDTDPAVAQLRNEINTLKAQKAQETQQAQQAQQQTLQQQIETFRDAKDETGNSKHPHFDTVREDMSALLAAGRASGLDDAYEKAVRLHPDIYDAQIIEQRKQQEAAERKKTEEAKKAKAAKAKKAATGVKSGSASVKGAQPTSLKDEIAAAMAEVEGRS